MSAVAVLKTIEGDQVPLQGLDVDADIRDLLSEVTVTQTYRNAEAVNIEAVYTFPLPLEAVLLELTVTIGERVLCGKVIEKQTAEARYEEAITDGDTAIMLEQDEPGMYTMNVGNLQAGETVVIRFRYAMLQRWSGDHLRFLLPTTIAPRYGDPGMGGLAPHQQPEYDPLGERDYSLRVWVSGLLAGAEMESPSHAISVTRESGRAVIQLVRGAAPLDRDFVLNFRLSESEPTCLSIDRDIEGYVALASFKPVFDVAQDESPRSLKVVVDCSGSMGGDSIAQAREALLRILDSLRPQDYFNIVAFGSDHAALFGRQVSVNHKNIEKARRFVRGLDADRGGTEIGAALQAAYSLAGKPDIPQDVLLITDGEVWNSEPVLRDARETGHRIFTVGVGASVAEHFVRQLAETCGGACELVSPNENMAERIYRHFQRMCSPRARDVSIGWPVTPKASFPEVPGPVYEGDTVHAFAWFEQSPEGDASMEFTMPGGQRIKQIARLRSDTGLGTAAPETDAGVAGTLARIAAAKKLRSLDDAQAGAELACRYQLMSAWTNCLVVDVREEREKAEDLPALRKIPQMLSAGWGGRGTVMASMAPGTFGVLYRKSVKGPVPESSEQYNDFDMDFDMDFNISACLRRQDGDEGEVAGKDKKVSVKEPGPRGFVQGLNRSSSDWFIPSLRIDRLMLLTGVGLQDDVLEALREIVDSGEDERAVVIVFLSLLAESEYGTEMNREARRAIRKEYKEAGDNDLVKNAVLTRLTVIPLWDALG